MKRLISIIFAATFFSATLSAAPITLEQAKARLAVKGGPRRAPAVDKVAKGKMSLAKTINTPNGQPAVYVLTQPQKEGFLFLSADDTAAPLLGYSDSGSFDADNMPDNLRWWLDEYARQIDYANSHAVPAYSGPEFRTTREPIAPLIKTYWDQTPPFNDKCPKLGANRTYTGCVATTLAQLMNYWQYPEHGQGSISYEATTLDKRLTMNFASKTFDWANMRPDYSDGDYTEAEANAVATLMAACGYAVKMDYSTDASAALAMEATNALVKYFGYDPNMLYTIRLYYSATQWEEMMYQNLKNVGPIPYGGGSMLGGGHSFLCDGYDGNGYFHFNWGWSGASNGYFLLDALNPDILGTGGGAGGGYSFTQDAVFGVQPPTGNPVEARPIEITQGGSLTGTVKNSVLTFDLEAEVDGSWLNYNPLTVNVLFGAIFEPLDDTKGDVVIAPIDREEAVTFKEGYGTVATGAAKFVPSIDLSKLNLANGKYKVTFAANVAEDTNHEWLPVHPFYGYVNHLTLTKSGTLYSVARNNVPRLEVVDGDISNDLYYGGVARTTVKIANNSDTELTKGFAPVLYYYNNEAQTYQMLFIGSSQLVTVAPHDIVERSWDTELQLMANINGLNGDAELMLSFFDEATYNFYTDEFRKVVTMHPNPGVPSVNIANLGIDGVRKKFESVNGKLEMVCVINDKNNIPVSYTATLRAGSAPFCYQMLAAVIAANQEDEPEEERGRLYSYNGQPVIIEPGDGPHKFSTTIAFPNIEEGKYYRVLAAYLYGTTFAPFNNSDLTANSQIFRYERPNAITNVQADATTQTVYSMQGANLGTDWNALPRGIYIRNGRKIVKR